MQLGENRRLQKLESGQLWQIEHGYIYVVECGEQLIHFQMLRHPNQRAMETRMIGVEALLHYLQRSEGQLVNEVWA
ncbi:MAG TPA: hypothetical protein VL361_01830 [Candidatus Limnocylindrales bacterium]|jgi:hypothetical protein|nr:hypothetical protein [Candidatus Limnocylindrales bacterium]